MDLLVHTDCNLRKRGTMRAYKGNGYNGRAYLGSFIFSVAYNNRYYI